MPFHKSIVRFVKRVVKSVVSSFGKNLLPALGLAALSIVTGGSALLASFGITSIVGQFFAITAGSLLLSGISSALSPSLVGGPAPGVAAQASVGRNAQFKQPVTPWTIVYGEVMTSGPITYIEVTNDNKFLHMIITICSHPIERIETVYFGDEPIPVGSISQLNGAGIVQSGTYANKTRIQFDLGTTGAQPFPDLQTESSVWTDAFRQEGHTKAYFRLEFDTKVFKGGVPQIKFRLKGKKVLDTRTSTTLWGPNPPMCINDYLKMDLTSGGVGLLASEVNGPQLISSANTSDEFVTVRSGVTHEGNAATVTATFGRIELTAGDKETIRFQPGDRVQIINMTDTLPSPLVLSTDYYVIIYNELNFIQTVNDLSVDRIMSMALATTYADALSHTAIELTVGTGMFTIEKKAEPRYTLNGVISTSFTPDSILNSMRTSMAGRILPIGGVWNIIAGVWVTPTVTITNSDLAGPITLQTKHPRRDSFNAVKGVYINPVFFGQATEYPSVTNSVFQAEDGGIRIFRDLDLAFTSRAQTAQRIATIELQRHRRQISATLVLNTMGLQLEANCPVMITNDRFGWSSKSFEIAEWKIGVGGMPPTITVEISVLEADSTMFTFDENAEETIVDPPPRTNLGDPRAVLNPGAPNVVESLFVTRDGAGVKNRATLTWLASPDGFAESYLPAYKLNSSSDWIEVSKTPSLTVLIDDLAAGFYDFRVRSENALGFTSGGSETLNFELVGLGAAPAAVTNLTVGHISSIALLEWDPHPEADVIHGGKFLFRWTPNFAGTWSTSTRVGLADGYPGMSTQVLLPLRTGTYLMRAVDSIGTEGAITTIELTQARLFSFGVPSTITENPTFSGTHSNTAVVGSNLELTGGTLIDDWGLIDDILDWDFEGGVATSGTYTFSGTFDFGGVVDIRLTATLAASVVIPSDTIDARTTLVDTWDDWDGIVSGAGDAQIWVRQTADDPSGSPSWSSYTLLTVGDFRNRAFEFEARLSTTDPVYTIRVNTLSVLKEALV